MFACGPADATASFKSRLVLPFWYRLTQVVLKKRPVNGCSSSCRKLTAEPHVFVVSDDSNVRDADIRKLRVQYITIKAFIMCP